MPLITVTKICIAYLYGLYINTENFKNRSLKHMHTMVITFIGK